MRADAAELEARARSARAQASAALAELEAGSRREEVSQGQAAVRAAITADTSWIWWR